MTRALRAVPFALALIAGDALAQGDTTTSGVSRAFNPALSLNGLFLGAWTDRGPEEEESEHAHLEEGLHVQEVELRLTADVDPYTRADATLAFHEEEVAFEEVYVATTALPLGLGLRAGQVYVPISRENERHTHQLPFVQRSLVQQALFEESWSEVGAELRYLTAAPFFLELRGAAVDGGQQEWFASAKGEDLAYLAGLASLLDLGESTTFQIDAAYAQGRNLLDATTRVGSAAATLRHRQVRGRADRGLRLAAEYTYADRGGDPAEGERWLGGWHTYAQWQFSRRGWLSARLDTLSRAGAEEHERRWGLSAAFVPSEFQALRVELSRVEPVDEEAFTEFFVQYDFTIGSHPAHSY